MKRPGYSRAFVISCAVAMAAACNTNNRAPNVNSNADTTGTAGTRADQSDTRRSDTNAKHNPITVTGCLQQGDGHGYILTRINEPAMSVGTSGNDYNGAVQREQMRAAANSYRVDPSGDVKIDDLVGKQVRVSGPLTDQADLPKDSNRETLDIKARDIAKIDAASVTKVADNCGNEKGAGSSPAATGNRKK